MPRRIYHPRIEPHVRHRRREHVLDGRFAGTGVRITYTR